MMTVRPLDIVVFGLSITSAWGNGHATTYRALIRALHERGHRIRFFERDLPWYANNRDLQDAQYCDIRVYSGLNDLERHFGNEVRADVVILGSFVPEGARLAEWMLPRSTGVNAFYDIDTPVTLGSLERGRCEYLTRDLVPRFDLYLSFSGGPVLKRLRNEFGAVRPLALYCGVDPRGYSPMPDHEPRYDLGYLGTYSSDRQPALERLLLEPARRWRTGRFCVAGAQYPTSVEWPVNVARHEHLAPSEHRRFYNEQRITLNITRTDMIASGFSPSVRLFEAAACGVPIVTDEWNGIEEFFHPGSEVLLVRTTDDVLECLQDRSTRSLKALGARARARVLAEHTAGHRAAALERFVREAQGEKQPFAREARSESTLSPCPP